MADVNNDGYLDLYVSAVAGKYDLKGHNELFLNNKMEHSLKAPVHMVWIFRLHHANGIFDYDHDGDLDCYILNQSHHPHANIADTAHRRSFDSLSGDRFYRNDLIMNGKRGWRISLMFRNKQASFKAILAMGWVLQLPI